MRKAGLAAVVAMLVLLIPAAPVMAFGFCFSFGSKSHDRTRYSGYFPPYPAIAAPLYPAYGYSSPVVPGYDYPGIYYPPPAAYVTAPPGDDASE